jgi:hypothetical protein
VFFKIVQNILKAAWGFIPIVRSLGPTQPISARTGLKIGPRHIPSISQKLLIGHIKSFLD